jgi:hypothetical protein
VFARSCGPEARAPAESVALELSLFRFAKIWEKIIEIIRKRRSENIAII